MKKFIIAAAIVCATAVSQAASVQWTCTNVYKDSANKNSGVAYLMLASDVADFTALAGKGATAPVPPSPQPPAASASAHASTT